MSPRHGGTRPRNWASARTARTPRSRTRCETYAAKHQAYRARRTATENAAARHSGPDPLLPRMFSELNWDTPRPVTVWANEDADTTNETITMTHRVVSDDANYDGITVPDLAVTVIDNDTPQVIGVWTQPGDRQLVVNWTATDKATGYKVQWKAPGDNYNTNARMATITSGSTTTYTIPNLTNGTEYTVLVTSTWTGHSDSPTSDPVTGTPTATP